MITLHQFGVRLTAVLDDLTEAAFAALAWIEEDDLQLAAGPDRAARRAPRPAAPRHHAKSSRQQPPWSGRTARWVM